MRLLRRQRLGRLLQVSRVKLREIPRDALLQLRAAPFHFPAREVLVSVVYGLEPAAINGNAGACEEAAAPAKHNDPGASLADGLTIVLAEVGYRLVIGTKSARQPHHLNIAPSLSLQSAARLNPIEVAVNVEL